MPQQKFELTIASRPENLSRVAEFVGETAQECGLSEKETFAVSMAVDEACTNVIEHAYAGQSHGEMTISCHLSTDECRIIIRDRGRPFDPAAVPEPDVEAPLEEREAGGLGIFLMRQLMDKVDFQFDPDQGNTMTMVRYRTLVRSRPAHSGRGITTVEVRGRLDAALGAELEAELQKLRQRGENRLIVDFSNVRYISSTGLRTLLVALKQARRADGDLKLVGVAPKVLQVFRLAGFHQLFEMYPDEAQAARAFGKAGVR